ncbi:MAG: xanthine phosphoribosyltransferase [Clostridia bacterium]|nr:xanthine phosphoribosyltransferase [Clostridia bacterium]
MKLLEEKIMKDGAVLPGGILKVDGFLNHRIDVGFMNEAGREFSRLFAGLGINKILTVEASGIGIACIVAQYFDGADVLFAKKNQTKNLGENTYSATVSSFTHGRDYLIRVSKDYLNENDRVLIVDDFLAVGHAAVGMIELCKQAGATVCGVGICIEKAFQGGGKTLREMGVNLHSLAIVQMGEDGSISFIDDADAAKVLLCK